MNKTKLSQGTKIILYLEACIFASAGVFLVVARNQVWLGIISLSVGIALIILTYKELIGNLDAQNQESPSTNQQ